MTGIILTFNRLYDYPNSFHLPKKLKERYSRLSSVESAQQLKLRIAKRKLAEKLAEQNKPSGKQSQAQKWAIHRKKQQLNKKENNAER